MKRSTVLVRIESITLIIFVSTVQLPAASPTNWEIRPSPTTVDLHAVVFDGARYVAVGAGGTVLISSTGSQWSQITLANTNRLRAVTFGNGLFVAGGDDGNLLLTSANGAQWTPVRSATANEEIHGLVHAGGRFVGVGRFFSSSTWSFQAYAVTSVNGTDWQALTPSAKPLRAVTFGNGMFVAVGENGTILTSSDGTSWTPQYSPITNDINAVTYFNNSRFVASGMFGYSLNSLDGFNWFESSRASFSVRALVSGGGYVVAVGRSSDTGRTHPSADGYGWPGENLVWPKPLNAVAYGNNNWLAVGEGGIILQTQISYLTLERVSHELALYLTGPPGRYRIDTSVNLIHWSPVADYDFPEPSLKRYLMRADFPSQPMNHFRASFLP